MKRLNLFIELIRLKKPIGFMLLFWPCSWGLTLAYDFKNNLGLYFFTLTLFFLGSVLMRSAGCIINDILDKDYDKKIFRTKNRPIASGKISIFDGIVYVLLLCSMAFLILINFNILTIVLAVISMPFAFTYPLMKRFTYWPQLFLGITFNYGIILGYTSVINSFDALIIALYIGSIFWTLGYDTIYGFQDIKDDEIIGVKSTSIKFQNKPFKFLFTSYMIFYTSIVYSGYLFNLNNIFYLLSIIIFLHLFLYQLKNVKLNNPASCLKIFKSNNLLGMIILILIIIGKI